VGAGPWDPELLTLGGKRRLEAAEVVIADYLANPDLLFHAPRGAEIIQRQRGVSEVLRLQQPELNTLMIDRAKAGLYVVRLKGGDPCMFGRGGEEAQVLRQAGIDFEFVPGVSSPIAAPQAAGIPVTHRDHTPAVTFVSGYEAYDKAGLHVEWEHLARSAGTIVLMMSVRNARDNAGRLMSAGRAPTTPAAVVRWGTRGIQQTVVGTLADIADRVDEAEIRAPAVMVVGDVVRLREELAWLERRPLFGHRIVVTRGLERSQSLAERLAKLGADVATVPCVAIDPPTDPIAFEDAVARVATFDGVILTSPNGADAFMTSLLRQGLDVRALAHKHVVVVGEGTAKACRHRGLLPDLVPDEGRSEGIVETLRDRDLLRASWLHVRAEQGRDELGRAIQLAGGTYALAIAYRVGRPSVPGSVVHSLLPKDEGGEGFDAICFASGRTARHFLETVDSQLGEGAGLRMLASSAIVSLGPITSSAMRELGIVATTTASEPSEAGLVSAMFHALGLDPSGKPSA